MNCLIKIFIILMLLSNQVIAQKEDHIWPLGSPSGSTKEQMKADSIIKRFWPFDFNFNQDPMRIVYKLDRISDPNGTLSSICNQDGQLFCYSHGRSVFDANSQFAINGDTVGYDIYWTLWSSFKYNF